MKEYDKLIVNKDLKEEYERLVESGLKEEQVQQYINQHENLLNQKQDEPSNVKRFELLCAEKTALYARKNKDYGNSFDESLDEDGLLAAKIRMKDKLKRFVQLINNPAEVTEEKVRETLIDLSNYADMTIMWMDQQEDRYLDPVEIARNLKTKDERTRASVDIGPGIVVGYNFKEHDYDVEDGPITVREAVAIDNVKKVFGSEPTRPMKNMKPLNIHHGYPAGIDTDGDDR